MPRIEVDPGELGSASGAQDGASRILASAGPALNVAAADASGSAGSGAAYAAIGNWGEGWSIALQALAAVVGQTATNVGAAGGAYTATDATAMPGGPR